MKKKILSFLLGALTFGSIASVFAFSYYANEINFTSKDNTWDVNNIENSINHLHNLEGNALKKIVSSNVQTTYKQAHGSSSNNLSINTTKGKYLVLLIYSYSGAMTTKNYSNVRTSNVSLTPTNGNCSIIDSNGYTSSGGQIYSGSQYFDQTLDFIFYRCSFYDNGSLVSTTRGTNSYDPDSYILRYIKIE